MTARAAVLIGAAAFIAMLGGCQQAPAAPSITDGCYYAGRRPVLRIAGNHADILVPSDVPRVGVVHDPYGNAIRLAPGVLLDSNETGLFARADPRPQSYPAKPGARPGFDLHVMASGEIELRRGGGC